MVNTVSTNPAILRLAVLYCRYPITSFITSSLLAIQPQFLCQQSLAKG